jgi:hypothetical protein
LPPLLIDLAIDLPGLGQEGPDDLRGLLTACFILMFTGFAIGIFGHLTRSRTLVAIGVTIVLVGTVAFVLAVGRFG